MMFIYTVEGIRGNLEGLLAEKIGIVFAPFGEGMPDDVGELLSNL